MEIISATYVISNPSVDKCPQPDRPEYAFTGRSNVGKSSLINMLCNKTHLAKTSATPGKTQLINHFEIISAGKGNSKKAKGGKWYLVDLPGYGYASASKAAKKTWGKMIEDYIRKRENLVSLFVLIDSRHEPQQIDIDFINQLGKWKIPFAIVFTKADKNKPGKTKRQVELFQNALRTEWESLPAMFVTSALDKTGRKELLAFIESINSSLS
jgi:GTP-binding protein